MRKLGSVAALVALLALLAPLASAAEEAIAARSADLRGDVELVSDEVSMALAPGEGTAFALDGTGIEITRMRCLGGTPGTCSPDQQAPIHLDSGNVALAALRPGGHVRLDATGVSSVFADGARLEPGAGAQFWETPDSSWGRSIGDGEFLLDPATGTLSATLGGAFEAILQSGEVTYSGETGGSPQNGRVSSDGNSGVPGLSSYFLLVRVAEGSGTAAGMGLAAAREGRVLAANGAKLATVAGDREFADTVAFHVQTTSGEEGPVLALTPIPLAEATPEALKEDKATDTLTAREAATYGAVAAGVAAVGAAVWYWPSIRWAATVLALPLYSRIERGEVMEHETRERIYALVKDAPGIHAHEIASKAGVGWGTAVYHLKMLEDHKLVVSERQGRYKRFFLAAGYTGTKDAIGAMRNATTAAVAEFIARNPGAIQREVCVALGISPSLVSWHIEKLESADLVKKLREGRTVKYFAGPMWNAVAPHSITVDPATVANN